MALVADGLAHDPEEQQDGNQQQETVEHLQRHDIVGEDVIEKRHESRITRREVHVRLGDRTDFRYVAMPLGQASRQLVIHVVIAVHVHLLIEDSGIVNGETDHDHGQHQPAERLLIQTYFHDTPFLY